MRKLLVALNIIGITTSLAYSNGFQINEQGAKALGMGGAFVAQADDPSAVYFNPAGITQLDGIQLSLGVSPISPRAKFENTSGKTTDAEKNTFYIPNFYYTQKLTDKLSVGVGAFSNFGLATEWPKNWDGRYIVGGTNAEIVTLSLNPNIAYKLTDKLSIGGGVVFQKADITLENQIRVISTGILSTEGSSKLTADSTGWGWNIAIHYKPTENLSFGASYRSKIKQKLEGHGEHTKLDNITGPYLPFYNAEKTPGKAELTLPDIAYIGAAWTNKTWTFELNGQWTGWSSYDKLKVDFDGTYLNQKTIESPKYWKDVWAIRFGTQYKLNETVSLRAGIIRDFSPIPEDKIDPLVPSGDRWLYALGAGFNFGKLTLDIAYNYLDDKDNKLGSNVKNSGTATGGTFKDVYAHIFGVNISYKF